MKATSSGASRMTRTMNKALCIDVIKLPFPQAQCSQRSEITVYVLHDHK